MGNLIVLEDGMENLFPYRLERILFHRNRLI